MIFKLVKVFYPKITFKNKLFKKEIPRICKTYCKIYQNINNIKIYVLLNEFWWNNETSNGHCDDGQQVDRVGSSSLALVA